MLELNVNRRAFRLQEPETGSAVRCMRVYGYFIEALSDPRALGFATDRPQI